MKTLVEFINGEQTHFSGATGKFSRILNDIGIAAKIVNREINTAGLGDILDYKGTKKWRTMLCLSFGRK